MRTCQSCGAAFEARSRKVPGKFCGRACHHKAQFIHGRNIRGYKIISVGGKQVYEHRWVMEQFLGRKLSTSEHVHHINGNKGDNRPCNLEILSNSAHVSEHFSPTYDIELAKRLYDAGIGYKRLGEIFGVCRQNIRETFGRRGWHIGPRPKMSSVAADAVIASLIAR